MDVVGVVDASDVDIGVNAFDDIDVDVGAVVIVGFVEFD